MVKKYVSKSARKTSHSHNKGRGAGHYARRYFFVITVSLVALIGGTIMFGPKIPCANSKSCGSDLSVRIENGVAGTFEGKTVSPPVIDSNFEKINGGVLGASTSAGGKHNYVDLETQTLYAYQGNEKVFQTLVSSGRWNKTPVGNFHIWEKLVSTRMAGGEGDDAYDLPNVPYVMYFYNDFGLHGAYWHDNFGHTMSHGCVNMRQIDAKQLYGWADGPQNGEKGTAVSICEHFTAPNNCQQTNPIND